MRARYGSSVMSMICNHIVDDHVFKQCTNDSYCASVGSTLAELNESMKTFCPFDTFEDSSSDPLHHIDPDEQYYKFMPNLYNNSLYYDESSFSKKCQKMRFSSSNFSLIHFNVRSAPKNLSSVDNFLHYLNNKFTVIGLTETWFKSHNVDLYSIPGYIHENNYRDKKVGGGVSMCILDSIEYIRRDDLEVCTVDIESIFVEINKEYIDSSCNVIIGVIYRPPNREIINFQHEMSAILNKLKQSQKHCYLMGDFNINILRSDDHPSTSDFIDLMYSNSFVPLINKPTRITQQSATLIDNIYTNCIDKTELLQGIFFTDISDHLPIFMINNKTITERKKQYIFKRSFNIQNSTKFREAIGKIDWNDILMHISNPQDAFTVFHKQIYSNFQVCFPLKQIKLGYKTRKPWLTTDIKNSICMKNKLYVKSNKIKSPDNKETYLKYKSKLNATIRKLERDHIENLLVKYRNNLAKSWQVMKDVINKNKQPVSSPPYFEVNDKKITDKNKIANSFNEFYINIGPNLCKSLPPSDVSPLSYLKNKNNVSMFLNPTSEMEIKKIIASLKVSSPGWDEIGTRMIKDVTDYLLMPLAYVFNLSLSCGVFPAELKVAKVIPLHKGDSKHILSNYRPVSVLPFFSKILEKIMYSRLISFINKHNILYKLQFGFREDHSTGMALTLLVDKVASALEKGECVLGVFLDFSKAFDCLNHNILFQKLNHYGVRGTALSWFQSYLSDRKQYVYYDGVSSECKNIVCGVPQGSILGPILFLLYINDIVNVSDKLFPLLYADDTNVFLNGKNVNKMIETMNSELEKIVVWLKINKLKLNVKKTHYMVFSSGRKSYHIDNPLFIDNEEVKGVSHTKFLGVIIDKFLSWDFHLDYIKNKIAKGLGIICKARKYLNMNCLRTLYYSFIYPYMNYCIEVWGSAGSTRIERLVKLQKKAIRIITCSRYRDHTQPLFLRLNLLTVSKIHVFKILTFMFKYHHGNTPKVFNEMFVSNESFHTYSTRQKNNLRVPLAKSSALRRCIRVTGVRLWNRITEHISVKCSLHTFKWHLRKCMTNEIQFQNLLL